MLPFLLLTDCRLVHVQATAALQTYCQQELSSIHSRVHVAQQLQTLDMSLQTPTYQALLSKELLSGVALRSMGQYKLGWVKGISRPSSQQVSKWCMCLAQKATCRDSEPDSVIWFF